MRAEKALLVGIKYGYERHFRQVETLTQQIDTYEHVDLTGTQIIKYLDAVKSLDIGVHIGRPYVIFGQIVIKFLGHGLGQRGYKHTLIALHTILYLVHQVIDLIH